MNLTVPRRLPSLEQIREAVAVTFGISTSDLAGGDVRVEEAIQAREAYVMLARDHTICGYICIARANESAHSSSLDQERRGRRRLGADAGFAELVERARQMIGANPPGYRGHAAPPGL